MDHPALAQPANIALTVAQGQILINSLCSKTGYLNIRLFWSEYAFFRILIRESEAKWSNENELWFLRNNDLAHPFTPWALDLIKSALALAGIDTTAAGDQSFWTPYEARSAFLWEEDGQRQGGEDFSHWRCGC